MNKKQENNPFRRFIVILTPWNDFVIEDVGPIEEPSLDFIQSRVAGWIEGVTLNARPKGVSKENPWGFYAWINEEGGLEGLPVNEFATALYNSPSKPFATICGNMVVLGRKPTEYGDITPPLTLSEVVDLRDTLMERTGAELHVLWSSEGKLYKI